MIKSGVREIRQNLTEYLKRVEKGEEVVITRHDQPIAKLVPIRKKITGRLSSRNGLRRLIISKGKPLSKTVRDLREDRF